MCFYLCLLVCASKEYLSCITPTEVKKTFLVHGDYDVQLDWREKLIAKGFKNIEIPEKGSSWELK